jgi:low affinity Fe/Cu permease
MRAGSGRASGAGRARDAFSRFSRRASDAAGSGPAFTLAVLVVLAWLVTGPLFGFSDTWQLAINTGTTIVTFLMVFLIQQAQNKDTRVLQLKLDELVAATEGASNRLIDLEDLSDEEIEHLRKRFAALARDAPPLGRHTTVEEEPAEPGEPRLARRPAR